MTDDAAVLRAISAVFEAGAKKSRQWPHNIQAQVQSEVYAEMADEARHQAHLLES